ncbi:MAG TPA: calcium/proton exchanger [Nitrososphaeraceae archaeon]|nr:calcium/proton exchanger [Nitrososphaeraceae archaeon]
MSKSSLIYLLLIFTPIAIALEFINTDHIVIFVVASVALIPLAKLIGDSTEHLSVHYGATLGSLLNVTFGNAAEIIIAIVAINAGLIDLVKASITGAILGNILLIFGLSILAGGIRYKEQYFSQENVGLQSSMLFLAIIGLAIPTILVNTLNADSASTSIQNQLNIQILSDILAFLLLAIYIAGIIFTFFTHKHLFLTQSHFDHKKDQKEEGRVKEEGHSSSTTSWSKRKSFLFLGLSMAGVIAISEILVGSVEVTAKQFGFGELFVGAIIIGIVGNAAEHSSAIVLARKGKIELSIGIAAGSGTQIALFVVPILVIAGILMNQPFSLVFTLFELVTIFLAAIILNLISRDGKSNWFEGILLTFVYVIIAIGFFFIK